MRKIRNNHPDIAKPIGNYTRSIRAGDMLFISGCTAVNTPSEKGDIMDQTDATLARIKRIVEAEGGNTADVVRMTIYITSMQEFRAQGKRFDQLMEQYFQGRYPTSTLVEVTALARPTLKVELEATAVF
jgi:enamine deaminase RidA (YjgF/YER057c/UK114 family)